MLTYIVSVKDDEITGFKSLKEGLLFRPNDQWMQKHAGDYIYMVQAESIQEVKRILADRVIKE